MLRARKEKTFLFWSNEPELSLTALFFLTAFSREVYNLCSALIWFASLREIVTWGGCRRQLPGRFYNHKRFIYHYAWLSPFSHIKPDLCSHCGSTHWTGGIDLCVLIDANEIIFTGVNKVVNHWRDVCSFKFLRSPRILVLSMTKETGLFVIVGEIDESWRRTEFSRMIGHSTRNLSTSDCACYSWVVLWVGW